MCTYTTERCALSGSGKGPARWTQLATATVYYDHPVHAMADHTLNIDLAPADGSPGARVALELSAEAAVQLAATIVQALGAVPADLTGLSNRTLAALEALKSVTAGKTS
jgi:Family of unknown function (DUF6295)